MLELCSDAVKIYPFEEWQLLKIDCLLAMNRYKEALKVYEDATTMFFEGAGTSPSEKMLSRFRAMSSQIQYAMGDLGDIKNSLKEKDIDKGDIIAAIQALSIVTVSSPVWSRGAVGRSF